MTVRALLVLLITGVLAAVLPGPSSEAAAAPPVVVQTMQGRSAEGANARYDAPQAPIAFSMVGFSLPAEGVVSFRTSRDGRRWSAWRTAETAVDEGPDASSIEARRAPARPLRTEPQWVGEASWLQVRTVRMPTDSRRLDASSTRELPSSQIDAHLIDTEGLNRSLLGRAVDSLAAAWRGTPTQAAATSERPPIVTRPAWGANESWRRGRPSYAPYLQAGAVHHTVGSNAYSPSEAPGIVRGVYAYHTRVRGWSDIGYNFLVDRFGTVYEGRRGGVDRNVIGAHAGGFNTGTFGVSVMGNFSSARPTGAALDAITRVVAWKLHQAGIRPGSTTVLLSRGSTRYRSGTRIRVPRLVGHRDLSATSCPGGGLYAYVPALRQRIARELASSRTGPSAGAVVARSAGTLQPPVALRGSTLRGRQEIWWPGDDRPFSFVDFRLDDPEAEHPPLRRDYRKPFRAGVIDTRRLGDGPHVLTVTGRRPSGAVRTLQIAFTVANPPPAPPEVTWSTRINAGGRAVIGPDGRRWQRDTYAQGGHRSSLPVEISGTDFDELYASARSGMAAYHVPVPVRAVYRVTLKFAELYWLSSAQRVFDVRAEGRTRVRGLDLVSVAGPLVAHDRAFEVAVNDGVLDLAFPALRDVANVAGVRVDAVAPALTSSASGRPSDRRRLAGADVDGNLLLEAHWPTGPWTREIAFHLDDSEARSRPFAVARGPRYVAGRLRTGKLDNGRHTLTTVVRRKQAPPLVRTEAFAVRNGVRRTQVVASATGRPGSFTRLRWRQLTAPVWAVSRFPDLGGSTTVRFWLDRAAGTRPSRVDKRWPFTFGRLDPSRLSPGEHRLISVVQRAGWPAQRTVTTFFVPR
ncbi:MAG: malectin domain-containing carbohydrate-binding protein [Egibacteraceae bacterium]